MLGRDRQANLKLPVNHDPHLFLQLQASMRNKLEATSKISNTGEGPTFDQLYETMRLCIRAEPDNYIILGELQKGDNHFAYGLSGMSIAALGRSFGPQEIKGIGGLTEIEKGISLVCIRISR